MLAREKVTAILAAAILGAAVPSYASVNDSLTLELNYVGSLPTATANADTKGAIIAGTGFTTNNLTLANNQVSSEINFFDVYMLFTPGSSTPNDTFASISFSSTLPSSLSVPTTSSSANTAWFANNPQDTNSSSPLYSNNTAQAVSPYFTPVLVQQENAGNSLASLPGQAGSAEYVTTPVPGTLLGRFGVVINGPLASAATITLSETTGNNFSVFQNNQSGTGTVLTGSAGVTSATYSIAAPQKATISLSPSSPGTLAAGSTVTVSDTAAAGSDSVSLTNISFTAPLNGTFSQTGLSTSAISPNNGFQTGTIVFTPNANVLNGLSPTGKLTFTANGTKQTATNGPISASYTLNATTSGAIAPASTAGTGTFGQVQTATLGANTSLAGISSNTSASQGNGVVGTTATFLYGTETSAGTIDEAWRTHTTIDNAGGVLSDVVQITGVTASPTNPYVLEMTYNPADIPAGMSASELSLGEYFGPNHTGWVNAASNDQNGLANTSEILAPWSAQYLTDGQWGVDTVGDDVWAVLDHDAIFAVIPEPASLGVLALGATGLLARRRRR